MSENLLDTDKFGKASIEAGQGYEKMAPSVPDLAPLPDIDLETAVSERGSAGEAVEEITYNQVNRDGTRSGEASPKNQSISAERGAEDLTNWRERQRETNQALLDQQLKQQLDAARSPLGAEVDEAKAGSLRLRTPEEIALLPIEQQIAILEEQRQHAAQQQGLPQPQQQPGEQPQAQPADQDISRVLQDNPRLMEAINQQRQADMAAGQQAAQYAAQVIDHNAKVAVASIFAHFPEVQQLANMSPQQQQAAVQMLARSNPQRFQEIQREYAGIQQVLQADAQVKQRQAVQDERQYQAEWSKWSDEEDAKFLTRYPEMADPEKASQINARARSYLLNAGLSNDDIGRLWNGQASLSLRDHRAQAILFDAMKFRAAQAAVPNARRNAPARVQKPGYAGAISPQSDVDMRALNSSLVGQTGIAATRTGAQIIAERRARNGRR